MQLKFRIFQLTERIKEKFWYRNISQISEDIIVEIINKKENLKSIGCDCTVTTITNSELLEESKHKAILKKMIFRLNPKEFFRSKSIVVYVKTPAKSRK